MKNATHRQFRTFLAVVHNGTMAAAAQQLNLTPPAVSIQIRQLEDQAGVPLLDRSNEGVRPTEAGKIVFDAASRLEDTVRECGDRLRDLRGLESGHAAVGGVSTAKYFVPRAFAAFAKTHPQIDLKLVIGNRAETISALESYDIDIAIMGRPPRAFEVEFEAIGAHPHVIIAPPDHAFANSTGLSPADLAGETFLTREPGSGTRALTQELFVSEAIAPPIGVEMGSNETIKQAVMAGLGIALISAHTIAVEINDGRLTILDVEGLPIVREWFVVHRRDKRLLPASGALWDFLKTEGSTFLPRLTAAASPP